MSIRLLLCFLILQFTSYSQIKFPEADTIKGYENSDVHARVAYPINQQNRIWVKGSLEKQTVKLVDVATSNSLIIIKLQPPFFTEVINVNAEKVKVIFCENSENCTEYVTLYPGHFEAVKGEDFSLLIYGCMEPFLVEYEDDKPISKIFEGENNSSFRIRNLFKTLATEKTIRFNDSIKEERNYVFKGLYDSILLNGRPKMILTTGDQVYVDAGYGTKMKNGDVHPISAWETKRRPKPFNSSLENYQDYLNMLYNASYSFSEIEEAHHRLPVLPAIDDHELRDGWGSQGDEYEKGIMNPELAGHFKLGRQAFIEHQLLLSNYPEDKAKQQLKTNKTLDYSFKVNGKNGYVFDLRSARNINENILLGDEQWENFEQWLNALDMDQEIILVTSVPVTLRPLKWIENIGKLLKPELRDDARDGWNSKNNQQDRNRLLQLLTHHRIVKDIKPIFVSGDVHKSALIEIWVDPNVKRNGKHDVQESMILGYEIVASGISHEFIKTGISKSIFKLIESQRIGDGLIEFDYMDKMASVYPLVRKSIVAQNFAAIEFSENENTKIHTFIFNQESESLEQHYINLDFDKKITDEDYFLFDDKNDKAHSKKDFSPPIPDGMRVIFDTSQKL